jgi:hypothetical protein
MQAAFQMFMLTLQIYYNENLKIASKLKKCKSFKTNKRIIIFLITLKSLQLIYCKKDEIKNAS